MDWLKHESHQNWFPVKKMYFTVDQNRGGSVGVQQTNTNYGWPYTLFIKKEHRNSV